MQRKTQRFDEASGRALADTLRAACNFDFVSVSIVNPGQSSAFTWHCASGNVSERYRRIYLPADVGVLGLVASSRAGLVVEDSRHDISRDSWYQFPIVAAEGLKSFVAFPLFEGTTLSLIVACAYRDDRRASNELLKETENVAIEQTHMTASDAEPMRLGRSSAMPVHAAMTHRIIQAQEDERARISRELHDGLAQELLLVQIELRKAKYLSPDEHSGAIERASDQIKNVLSHVAAIASNLRPAALDELGLSAAIRVECRTLERSFGVKINDDVQDVRDLVPDCEVAVYRIFQEAMTNACKYSQSETIDVSFDRTQDAICLSVHDHGCGFDVEHPDIRGGGLGLSGMTERAMAFDGTVEVRSWIRRGTNVDVTIPLDASKGNFGERGELRD